MFRNGRLSNKIMRIMTLNIRKNKFSYATYACCFLIDQQKIQCGHKMMVDRFLVVSQNFLI